MVTTPKQFEEAIKGADLKKGIVVNFLSRRNNGEDRVSKFEILKDSGD